MTPDQLSALRTELQTYRGALQIPHRPKAAPVSGVPALPVLHWLRSAFI